MMAWIAWFPPLRGLLGVGIYSVDILDHLTFYFLLIVRGYRWPQEQEQQEPETHQRQRQRRAVRLRWLLSYDGSPGNDMDVSILVHVVWWMWHTYLPFSQWYWFVSHRTTSSAGVFFARGTAVGVLLVSMSIDYKTRVIRAVGLLDKGGPYIALAMCILSLFVRLSLTGLMSTELIMAAIKSWSTGGKIFVPIYVVFSIAWGLMSFKFIRGRDDDSDEDYGVHVHMILRPIAGLFFSCFTCTIAFIIFSKASASNGLSLPASLRCDATSTWNKIQSILF